MAASTGAPRQTAATFAPIPFRKRIYGFGSIYGKTIRDSRLLVHHRGRDARRDVAGPVGRGHRNMFPTPRTRLEVDKLVGSHAGVDGQPVWQHDRDGRQARHAGRLRHLEVRRHLRPWHRALWSIFALSGTLAGEAAARQPGHRRRVAVRQAPDRAREAGRPPDLLCAGDARGDGRHLAARMRSATPRWATPIPLRSARWVRALGRVHRPVLRRPRLRASPRAGPRRLGRRRAARDDAALDRERPGVGGPLARRSAPSTGPRPHRRSSASSTGPALSPSQSLGIVLPGRRRGAVQSPRPRRDVGALAAIACPGRPVGVHGPVSRAFGDQLPRALSWGIGLAIWARCLPPWRASFADQVAENPTMGSIFKQIFPGFDFTTAGSWLQLYLQLFLIAAGFAAATFVSKWASDETGGRLEVVLATPLARAKWVDRRRDRRAARGRRHDGRLRAGHRPRRGRWQRDDRRRHRRALAIGPRRDGVRRRRRRHRRALAHVHRGRASRPSWWS